MEHAFPNVVIHIFCTVQNRIYTDVNPLLTQRRNQLFLILGFFFLTNAIIAEFIGTKIFSLEKTFGFKPAEISLLGSSFNFDMTAGVLLWPFVFILTDVINEYFGPKGVKRLSYIAVVMLVYSFVMVRIAMSLEGADFWIFSGKDEGINDMKNAFDQVFGQGLMIILGSLVAFLIGQIVDAHVFAQIKKKSNNRYIWLRATGSTVVSQFIDSYVVLVVAFYLGGNYSLLWVLQVGTINYVYKLIMAVVLLPLLYFLHGIIDRYLGLNHSKPAGDNFTQTT